MIFVRSAILIFFVCSIYACRPGIDPAVRTSESESDTTFQNIPSGDRRTFNLTDSQYSYQLICGQNSGDRSAASLILLIRTDRSHPLGKKDELIYNIEGQIYKPLLTDLDHNSTSEVLLLSRSFGSGTERFLFMLDFSQQKALIRIPFLRKRDQAMYRGDDSFRFISDTIFRTFPRFRPQDARCCPSGGTDSFRYYYRNGRLREKGRE